MSVTYPDVSPRETAASVTDRIAGVALREKTHLWWWALFLLALAMLGWGAFSVGWLFANGIQVWGNNWPVMWGFPIINYVWWIGIASGGTLISSLFFITRAKWRSGISRIAETMTLFAAACAGIYPVIHLGRPWFFYWLFPYPNTMTLWPQFRSPLLWDFIAVLTYILCSVMFWVLGALPDFATLRDRATWRPAQIFYGILAMGFRGTGPQWRRFHAAYATIASLMAPLVCSVHSVVGLDFAGAAFPGWYSTQFPPFFVVGAVLSGFGVVLMLVVPLRVALGLKPDITERHLEVLGRLTLTTSLCLTYCYMMDAFDPFYAGEKAEIVQFMARVFGFYGWIYWLTITLNCVVPQASLVAAAAHQPGRAMVHRVVGVHRHVVRAVPDRRGPAAPPAAAERLGHLHPDDLGFRRVRRHGGPVPRRHPPVRAHDARHPHQRDARADPGRQERGPVMIVARFAKP